MDILKKIADIAEQIRSAVNTIVDLIESLVSKMGGPVAAKLNFGPVLSSLKDALMKWFLSQLTGGLFNSPTLA
jgi:hypothetical protein